MEQKPVRFVNWVADSWAGRIARKYNLLSADWYARNGYRRIHASLVGESGYTTARITEERALNCSVVYACSHVISEDVGSLPLVVYERRADGKYPTKPPIDAAITKPEQRLYELLHDEPNAESTAMEFREALTHHAVLWGNGYARKIHRGGNPQDWLIGMYLLLPNETTVKRDSSGNLVYINKEGNSAEKTYKASEIFHLRGPGFDGVMGKSVVSMAASSIDLALAAQEYGQRFLGQGGRPMGVLTHDGILEPEGEDKLRASFSKVMLQDSHRLLVLEQGMKFQPIGMPAKDMQFLETRLFQVPDICRWFRMPPHKVQDLTKSAFANIWSEQLSYYTDTLRPWLVRWEQAIRRQLLTPEQKRSIFAEHRIEGLLRGDFETQIKALTSGIQNGIYSINEAREYLNLNNVEGGEKHRVQMQNVDINSEPEGDSNAVTQ